MEKRSFQHLNPIWREKANFIIGVSIRPLAKNPKEEMMEQLWARKIDFCRFEICCIPMFAYGLALGDVVETDHDFLITNIYQKSGRIAIRVWINEQITQEKVEELIGKILDLDCLVEWYSQHLLGIDCDIQTKTQSLLKILDIYQN